MSPRGKAYANITTDRGFEGCSQVKTVKIRDGVITVHMAHRGKSNTIEIPLGDVRRLDIEIGLYE
jgi:hypothetical protein